MKAVPFEKGLSYSSLDSPLLSKIGLKSHREARKLEGKYPITFFPKGAKDSFEIIGRLKKKVGGGVGG